MTPTRIAIAGATVKIAAAEMVLRTVSCGRPISFARFQKSDLRIVILTGGKSEAIRLRYAGLGVEDIYMGCAVKIKTYREFLEKYQLTNEEIIYVGDDIPDYEVMRECGCPCCPADACSDIKEISTYVSSCNGGEGCGRDVVEQVLRAQGKWLSGAKAFGW